MLVEGVWSVNDGGGSVDVSDGWGSVDVSDG